MSFRPFWEVTCSVPDCHCMTFVIGKFSEIPFHYPSPYDITDPGWYIQGSKCITRHTEKIYVNRAVYCPKHAIEHLEYIEKVKAWDLEESKIKKSYWFLFKKAIGKVAITKKPEPPWKV